jgi:transposase
MIGTASVTKKKMVHAAEQDRPDVALARAVWRENQHTLDPKKLVFVDETGAATDMARVYGRGPIGERVIGKVPYGHWKTTTFVAGLRCDQVVAPFVVDQPMNGQIFRVYVARCLCPALRPDDTVIMDNLAAHKVDGVRQMIEACGARLVYLPPYSPDLNPIEQYFAKLKAFLRKAKERTIETLWRRIGRLLDLAPQECVNYLRNAGYA